MLLEKSFFVSFFLGWGVIKRFFNYKYLKTWRDILTSEQKTSYILKTNYSGSSRKNNISILLLIYTIVNDGWSEFWTVFYSRFKFGSIFIDGFLKKTF